MYIDSTLSQSKKMFINIVSSLVVFVVSMLINLFLSPYIVKNIGVEANGFISLANTFISYATLTTIALNSMSGRFITIAIHKNNFSLANKYYNAVFWGNLVTVVVLLFPAIILIGNLEDIINIPIYLLRDVKGLFVILFINFVLSTALPSWATATFATNNLYLQSIRNLQGNLLKLVIICLLFYFLSPSICYVGMATLVATLYSAFFNFRYKKKLLPELNIDFKMLDLSKVRELISSGMWGTLNQVGQLLLSGMDLLIANVFISAADMGVLALAKTIPNVLVNLAGTLTSVFMPTLTISYAKNDKNELKKSLKSGMKLTGVLLTVPLTLLIIYGYEFYELWVPTEDAKVLQVLSVLTCCGMIFTSGTQCLYNIFTVTNKLKTNSLLILVSGFISTGIVVILLKISSLGIYAIAAVSSFVNIIRNMLYTVPFCAKYLGFKWNTFFPEVLNSIFSVVILTIVGNIIKNIATINSWLDLIVMGFITGLIGILINIFILLNKEERKQLINKLKRINAI